MQAFRQQLRHWLHCGGLIAYPTESCYGLGCLPRNQRALLRLLRLKRRPAHKGLIVIGDNQERFGRLLAKGEIERAQTWAQQWPAPLTLLLNKGPATTYRLSGKHPKLAVRVPAHAQARQLCTIAGSPLVSTSANLAGKKSIKTARECKRQFGSRVWVLPGRIGKRRAPSTIIDPDNGQRLR